MGEPPSKHVNENWAFRSRLVIVGERASCTGAASVYVMPQAALGRPQYYYDLHVRDRFGRDYASVQMRWDGVSCVVGSSMRLRSSARSRKLIT
jgi:hypothetical protein